ncbi:MAG: restriction endonuclease [Methanosarcina sp.]
MIVFDLAEYQTLIVSVDSANSPSEKGNSLELLCKYFFESINGIEVVEHDIRMGSEEIDLILWNAKLETVFNPWDEVILVECKNWSSTVGAPLLDNFISKLRRRCLKTGIFIAANGVTGGFVKGDGNEIGAVGVIREALQEGIRVIVIKMEDLRDVKSVEDIKTLIKLRYCGIFVHKVF